MGATSVNHFDRRDIIGRYSTIQRFQNESNLFWISSQLPFKACLSSTGALTGCRTPFELSIRKWFGVNDSCSSLSNGRNVKGREFTMCSASASKVMNDSSSNFRDMGNDPSAVFTDRTIRSQHPPICGADGGLNLHWVFVSVKVLLKLRLISRNSSSSSLLAPMKFVPLSLLHLLWRTSASNESPNCLLARIGR